MSLLSSKYRHTHTEGGGRRGAGKETEKKTVRDYESDGVTGDTEEPFEKSTFRAPPSGILPRTLKSILRTKKISTF